MQVHLIDGTYEMYRQHYGSAIRDREPPPFAGTIGVLSSTIQLLAEGATHIGVATDHVIESFRNDLYEGYKTSEGMEPVLLEQIPIIENSLRAFHHARSAADSYLLCMPRLLRQQVPIGEFGLYQARSLLCKVVEPVRGCGLRQQLCDLHV